MRDNRPCSRIESIKVDFALLEPGNSFPGLTLEEKGFDFSLRDKISPYARERNKIDALSRFLNVEAGKRPNGLLY